VSSPFSRRDFLRQLLGAGALAATGIDPLSAQSAGPEAFRFAFLTDLHLMVDPAARSDQGIAACLDAVENLNPRPEFILVGGDLVNVARDLTIAEAVRRLDLFQKIWDDHTSLPARWTFGNHDLVATNDPDVSPQDPLYAKGLFREHFHLPRLYYTYLHKGWRFIILDDVMLHPGPGYIGQLFPEEIAYLRADLDAHRDAPTVICTHIPILSNISIEIHLARLGGLHINAPESLTCTNGSDLTSALAGHNVRAVLCGHLHYYERINQNGVAFINGGAVCGNYWKGPVLNCREGFGVVDVGADGSFNFDYLPYGWVAS
jgi:Icc protein